MSTIDDAAGQPQAARGAMRRRVAACELILLDAGLVLVAALTVAVALSTALL